MQDGMKAPTPKESLQFLSDASEMVECNGATRDRLRLSVAVLAKTIDLAENLAKKGGAAVEKETRIESAESETQPQTS